MNGNALLAQFVLQGKSVPIAAQALGMSKNSLYRKIKGKTEFSRSEIENIIAYLGLDEKTAFGIFFTSWVS